MKRYSMVYSNVRGLRMEPSETGEYVTHADHLAELQRYREILRDVREWAMETSFGTYIHRPSVVLIDRIDALLTEPKETP